MGPDNGPEDKDVPPWDSTFSAPPLDATSSRALASSVFQPELMKQIPDPFQLSAHTFKGATGLPSCGSDHQSFITERGSDHQSVITFPHNGVDNFERRKGPFPWLSQDIPQSAIPRARLRTSPRESMGACITSTITQLCD